MFIQCQRWGALWRTLPSCAVKRNRLGLTAPCRASICAGRRKSDSDDSELNHQTEKEHRLPVWLKDSIFNGFTVFHWYLNFSSLRFRANQLNEVDSEDDLVLVFVDPSSEDAPAWPLQNALLLLARYRPGPRLVLAFRRSDHNVNPGIDPRHGRSTLTCCRDSQTLNCRKLFSLWAQIHIWTWSKRINHKFSPLSPASEGTHS